MTDGSGNAVTVALLDYREAFDQVDYILLIARLATLGIRSSVIIWIIDFLFDRTQGVKVNHECFSNIPKISAGVPQGTKLAPWLFLVMIKDPTVPEDKQTSYGNLQMIPLFRRLSLEPKVVNYKIHLTT